MLHPAFLALLPLLAPPQSPAVGGASAGGASAGVAQPQVSKPAPPSKNAGSSAASSPVRYELTVDVKNRAWKMTMELELEKAEPFELWIPRWSPGGYHIVDFGGYVEEMKAFDSAGKELTVTETEEPVHWKIAPGDAKKVRIQYSATSAFEGILSAKSMDVEANRITDTHAYVNSTSLFAFVPGLLDRPATVKVNAPEGWKIATPLDSDGEGGFTAPSYYRLEDSPFLMSPKLRIADFKVSNVPHRLAVVGKSQQDTEKIAEVCAKIAGAGEKVMGPFPYDHYVFLLGFLPEGGMGGLEHSFANLSLLPKMVPMSEIHHILAHEYFHLWCAERIQVEGLRRPDYSKPFTTGTLWLNEGATEYMQLLLQFHAGLLDETTFEEEIAQKAAQVHAQRKAATRRSLVDTSKMWINATLMQFMEISLAIYERGAVNFFCMDLSIRSQTKGKKGFADVLRYLMSEYAMKGKGFGEDELPAIFEKASGAKLQDFYAKYIAGKELPDLDEYLAPFGWKVNRGPDGGPTMGAFHDLGTPTQEQLDLRKAFFSLP